MYYLLKVNVLRILEVSSISIEFLRKNEFYFLYIFHLENQTQVGNMKVLYPLTTLSLCPLSFELYHENSMYQLKVSDQCAKEHYFS